MLFCCLCVFFLTVKLFYTMKLIYFEKSLILVFGFIIPSFFQFCKDHRAEKISHTETYLLCPTAKKPCVTGIFEKRKRTKVAIPIPDISNPLVVPFLWFKDFSYVVVVPYEICPLSSCRNSSIVFVQIIVMNKGLVKFIVHHKIKQTNTP